MWVKCRNKDDSAIYYINRATGETSQTIPTGIDESSILEASQEERTHYNSTEDMREVERLHHNMDNMKDTAIDDTDKKMSIEYTEKTENNGRNNNNINDNNNNLYPTCEDLFTAEMIIGSVSHLEKVERDPKTGKVSNESMKKAWKHYIKTRPVRDEMTDLPYGFVLNENNNDVVYGKDIQQNSNNSNSVMDNKPRSTWKSICNVSGDEFSDLGDGISLTFQFMKLTSSFFFIMWACSLIGWIIQRVDPTSITWVDVTFTWDLIFTLCFIAYMIYLRRGLKLHTRLLGKKNIMSCDYTIKVYNLPADVTAKEIHDYFSQFGRLHNDEDEEEEKTRKQKHVDHLFVNANYFNTLGVTLIRNDSELIDAGYTLMETTEALRAVDLTNQLQIDKLKADHLKSKKHYLKLREKEYKCTGTAYVTYASIIGKEKCLKSFRQVQRIGQHESTNFLHPIKFRNDDALTEKLLVKTAPEPSDILWKNQSVSHTEVSIRTFIVNVASFLYLIFIACIMIYFASYTKAYGIFGKGILGVIGNVLCCLTSIVILMPLASLLEKQHTRSKLEEVTFLKLAWFQWAGTIFATLYVFGLDDYSSTQLGVLSSEQMGQWGSGLPTNNCNITRFNDTKISLKSFLDKNIANLNDEQCWAFTLDLFGRGISEFLIGNLLGDIAIINMLDYLCPVWWVETKLLAGTAYYQKDLNKHFEGVDFKPFLRYQILLKFLLVGMTASCIDNPRILSLSVAICFYQCYGIEKFCFLLRYNKPPMFPTTMYKNAIEYGLPLALFIHLISVQLMFGITYEYVGGGAKGQVGDGKLNYYPNPIGAYGTVSLVFFCLGSVFICMWFLPLELWEFKESSTSVSPIFNDEMDGGDSINTSYDSGVVRHLDTTQDQASRMQRNLTFKDALLANQVHSDIGRLRRVEVERYIPNPRRREFGILKIN